MNIMQWLAEFYTLHADMFVMPYPGNDRMRDAIHRTENGDPEYLVRLYVYTYFNQPDVATRDMMNVARITIANSLADFIETEYDHEGQATITELIRNPVTETDDGNAVPETRININGIPTVLRYGRPHEPRA